MPTDYAGDYTVTFHSFNHSFIADELQPLQSRRQKNKKDSASNPRTFCYPIHAFAKHCLFIVVYPFSFYNFTFSYRFLWFARICTCVQLFRTFNCRRRRPFRGLFSVFLFFATRIRFTGGWLSRVLSCRCFKLLQSIGWICKAISSNIHYI